MSSAHRGMHTELTKMSISPSNLAQSVRQNASLSSMATKIPHAFLQVLRPVARVEARLAPTCHFDNEHEEENEIKGPDRKEDEEPVPKDLPVQLQDQHNKEYKCEDPCQEDSLSKRHVHLKRWPKGTASSWSEETKHLSLEVWVQFTLSISSRRVHAAYNAKEGHFK